MSRDIMSPVIVYTLYIIDGSILGRYKFMVSSQLLLRVLPNFTTDLNILRICIA